MNPMTRPWYFVHIFISHLRVVLFIGANLMFIHISRILSINKINWDLPIFMVIDSQIKTLQLRTAFNNDLKIGSPPILIFIDLNDISLK